MMAYLNIVDHECCYVFRMGGIIPPVARDLHRKYIAGIVRDALDAAAMSVKVGNACILLIYFNLFLNVGQ